MATTKRKGGGLEQTIKGEGENRNSRAHTPQPRSRNEHRGSVSRTLADVLIDDAVVLVVLEVEAVRVVAGAIAELVQAPVVKPVEQVIGRVGESLAAGLCWQMRRTMADDGGG